MDFAGWNWNEELVALLDQNANSMKHESGLNNIENFSLYLTETCYIFTMNMNWLMPIVEIIHDYSDNHMKHINILWAQCFFFTSKWVYLQPLYS
jgi:hypothetical protein